MCLQKLNKYDVYATSDLHGILPKIDTPFDLLLLAGDLVNLYMQRDMGDTVEWYEGPFVNWINTLPFKDESSKVLWIAGNHEVGWEKLVPEGRRKIANHITELTNGRAIYLEDDLYDFNGIKVYGTPWCKIFGNWAFMKNEDSLKEVYSQIPEDVDILLTHDAPYGTSDLCFGWEAWGRTPYHIGNKPLRDIIIEKCPDFNLHGHLHSANHVEEVLNDTKVFNVSLVDEAYKEAYSPLYLEIIK